MATWLNKFLRLHLFGLGIFGASESVYFVLWKSFLRQSEISIYCAGFPCTPFSMLGNRECLLDRNARQLYACVKRMKVTRPKAPRCEEVLKPNVCHDVFKINYMKNILPNHWGSITGKCDGILISGTPSGSIHRKELPRASCLNFPIYRRLCFANVWWEGGISMGPQVWDAVCVHESVPLT